jgi:hypothetical protein
MKQALGSFFLAVILSTAPPSFADQIPVDRMDGDQGSVATQARFHEKALQDVSAVRHFGLSTLKEGKFQIEFDPDVRMSDFRKDGGIAILGTQVGSRPGSNNRQVRLFDVDSKHGDSFGGNDENAHRKLNGKGGDDGDGRVSLVAIPEPESRTLLLFGLTGLGMVFYRRNWLRNAI